MYLSQKHKDDLLSSGLDESIIKDVGFYTCDASEANRLLDRSDIDCTCLVIPYPGSNDFHRLKPDGIILGRNKEPARYLQKSGTESKLFIHGSVLEFLTASNGSSSLPYLIIEGEKKTCKATQEFFLKEKLFLPIGISGVYNWKRKIQSGVDKKTGNPIISDDYISDIKKLVLDNKIAYICFDSNTEFNDQVQQAELELGRYLVGRGVSRVLNIRIPHEESYGKHGVGLDDYLIKHGNDNFKELVSRAGSTDAIKHSIKFIRKLPNKTYFDKLDTIVDLVIKDLAVTGSFYYDDTYGYYFNNITKVMLNLEEEEFLLRLGNDYGLYRDNAEFNGVHHKIDEYCAFKGKRIKIKYTAYFDTEDKSLYVYNNHGSIFFLKEGENIATLFNGYKNTFFKHRSDYSKIDYHQGKQGFFEQYILDVCNFQATEYTKLSPDQQKFLFTIWFYTLFFPNLMPTKPILVMTGDYGSGKSTIQCLVGKLLFGDSWNLSTVQGERDFLTSVINKYYLAYDNVEQFPHWLQNAICSLATGFKVEVRKMYSNMEMFYADPISYLAISSMSQGLYKRPDVASRCLIFRTKKITGPSIAFDILRRQLLEHRNEILSEVLDNLQSMCKYIDDRYMYFGNFRMADFANLGFKIATYFGREKEFEIILEVMSKEQQELPMEDNPLVDVLDRWLNNRMSDYALTTGELYAQLLSTAETSKLFFPFKSSVSFGKTMQTSLENLKLYYNINTQRAGGNRIKWLITFKDKFKEIIQ